MAKLAAIEIGQELPEGATKVLQGNFTMSLQTSNQRAGTVTALQMSGPVYVGDSAEQLNGRIDFYQAVIDRLVMKEELRKDEEMLAAQISNMALQVEQQKDLEGRKSAGEKLVTQEKTRLENLPAEIKNSDRAVKHLTAKIQAARERLGLTK